MGTHCGLDNRCLVHYEHFKEPRVYAAEGD